MSSLPFNPFHRRPGRTGMPPFEQMIMAENYAQQSGLPPVQPPAQIPTDARAQNQQTADISAPLPQNLPPGSSDLLPPPNAPFRVSGPAPTSARTPSFVRGAGVQDVEQHPDAATRHSDLLADPPKPRTTLGQRIGAAAFGGAAGWLNSSPSASRRGPYIPPAVTANAVRNIMYPNYDQRRADWEGQVEASSAQMGQERAERELAIRGREADARISASQATGNAANARAALAESQRLNPKPPPETAGQKLGGQLQAKYDFALKTLGLSEEAAGRFARDDDDPKLTKTVLTNQKTGDVNIVWHDEQGVEQKSDTYERAAERRAPSSGINLLTPEGLNVAVGAVEGGLSPTIVGRGAATRAAVFNEMGKRSASGQPEPDLPSAQAGYGADKSSLAGLQRQRDVLHAFEQTARKNIDVFKQQLKGLIDTGSPLLNLPLREASIQTVGSENVAAFKTARIVVVNEISRIVTQMGAAGVLTNEARAEVSSLIPEDATINQILRVLEVLDSDMANRISSMDEELSGIKERISTRGGEPAPVTPSEPAGMRPPSFVGPQIPPAGGGASGGASFRKLSGAKAGEEFTMTPEQADRARNEPDRWEEIR